MIPNKISVDMIASSSVNIEQLIVDKLAKQFQYELDFEIHEILMNMTKKEQYQKIDKLITRCNSIKEHLGSLGLNAQFDEVHAIVELANEIKTNAVLRERKLTKDEMKTLNESWEHIKNNYPNIK